MKPLHLGVPVWTVVESPLDGNGWQVHKCLGPERGSSSNLPGCAELTEVNSP